jgi:hypothetical protein
LASRWFSTAMCTQHLPQRLRAEYATTGRP